ncbi:DUF3142 domain-containing protein [Luteolibacter arcticus]|uniref:DUF3142 domain-containing protein n=1 Tax=Luteolibacter arcticus TaxID=1581411 RepID=A0ABT3GG42_9BACT|nr:DUF3142 domain-containing protein [Luteolibacter arcticus]MCW1922582.1 DUF3142 domain-containing protein [Luteolibacter arcticus]
MTPRRALPLLAIACWLTAGCERTAPVAKAAPDRTPAFWVWHRSSALAPAEKESLPAGSRLYRQIAEFGWRDGAWSPRAVAKADVLLENEIPVVRLDPGPAFLERPDAAAMLAKWLRHHFQDKVPASLQLDHDCPVRLLPRYAAFLRELRGELALKEISITALAGWIDSPAFKQLGEAADELLPMFYDLTADPPQDIAAGKAKPMAGPEAAAWIARWKSCRTPWCAGLANFERLSLFEADGKLVGHLKQWTPESIARADFLEALPQFTGGTGYRITSAASLHGTQLQASQLLIWRAPDAESLRGLIAAAFDAGARGIVWFALPGPGLRAAHSPSHLAALARGEVPAHGVTAKLESNGSIVLRNAGPGDLSLALGAPLHRLMLRSHEAGTFTTAGPGEFAEVATPLPPKFSHEIVLSFPRLLVGEEIASESGLIPVRGVRELQWSLDDSTPAPLP